jgi:pimeloyl-ACP methyl ester carboxylesterase
MSEVRWSDASDDEGRPTREFRITRTGKRDITGALWLPGSLSTGATLVCFGHGASGNRYQAPICHLAARFIKEAGLQVLSLDGPVHGLRQVGEGGRSAFFPEFQRDNCLDDMTDDWACAVSEVQSLDSVGVGKLAYFGLSMGSLFGIPFVASRQDVTVAALGLVGVESNFPHDEEILEAAANIGCPLLFLMQLEDELFRRDGYLKVFDTFSSVDKRLHANPGLHPEIPAEEIDFAFDFLTGHIKGTKERRIVNPLAE